MNLKLGLACAGVIASAFAAAAQAAPASTYTCAGGTPCIVASKELSKHRVQLKWSGQGKKYDFYRLTIRPHGGGQQKLLQLAGGKGGQGIFDLKKAGDYEFYLEGCHKPKKGQPPVCEKSSEHVRLNLR